MLLGRYFRLAIDWFIPADLKEDDYSDTYNRAQVMVGVLLSASVATICVVVAASIIPSYTPVNAFLASGITVLTLLGYIGCLLLFRASKSLALTANLYGLAAYMGIAVPGLFSGGYTSPSLQLTLVIPVWLFIMAGRRSGLVWAGIIFATHFAFFVATAQGYPFVQVMEPNQILPSHFVVWTLTCSMVVACLYLYDYHNQGLQARLSKERSEYAHEASHDTLTGLANRSRFYERLQAALDFGREERYKTAVIYIDLDNFKPINDEHGHHVGDEALKIIANKIPSAVRSTDTVARMGGDEFAVVMQAQGNTHTLRGIVNDILTLICEPILVDSHKLLVSASIGVVLAPDQGRDVDELLKLADAAMYKAKRNNQAVYFHGEKIAS